MKDCYRCAPVAQPESRLRQELSCAPGDMGSPGTWAGRWHQAPALIGHRVHSLCTAWFRGWPGPGLEKDPAVHWGRGMLRSWEMKRGLASEAKRVGNKSKVRAWAPSRILRQRI